MDSRRFTVLYSRAVSADACTFVVGFQTRDMQLSKSDQISVANVAGTHYEQLVVHSLKTGQLVFFHLEQDRLSKGLKLLYQSAGDLMNFTKISAASAGLEDDYTAVWAPKIFWADLKNLEGVVKRPKSHLDRNAEVNQLQHITEEPVLSLGHRISAEGRKNLLFEPVCSSFEDGENDKLAFQSDRRDDPLVWDPVNGVWHVFGARFSPRSRRKTYTWAYSQRALKLDDDPDEDGIATRYELGGQDLDQDGLSDEPLYMYGASPFLVDVFVEIDYMEGPEKSLRPYDEAIDLAVRELGKGGINLHVVVDSAVPFQENLGGSRFKWSRDFDPIKNEFFRESRRGLYHYVLFANRHNNGSASGRARGLLSSDVLVTLGQWTGGKGSAEQQAGTLLHELVDYSTP